MTARTYRLIFEGQIVPGRNIEEVKTNLSSFYNVDDDRLERFFTGQPIVLKTGLDYEEAMRHKDIFERAGLICRVEESQDRAPCREGGRSTQEISPSALGRLTRRRYSIVHPLFMSFFSTDFYQDVGRNWRGFSFVYLLFLLLLCWIPTMIMMRHKISDFVATSAREFLVQLPTITISHGEVSIDEEEPYFIKDPETGEVFAIIDTTGQYTSLNGVTANILITKEKAILRKNRRETRTFDLSDIESLRLDQNLIERGLRTFEKWFAVVLLPLAVFGSFLYRTIQVLIYAVIGIVFKKIAKANLSFQALISISIMAITPVLTIDTLLGFANLRIPLWGLWCFVLAMGFLFYGVKVNAEEGALGELNSSN